MDQIHYNRVQDQNLHQVSCNRTTLDQDILKVNFRKGPGSMLKTFYEGCSNMNASGFITFFTYMLRQNGKRFYKGLYVTFKLAPDLKTYTVYLSSYSPWNKGHVSILTNLML